MHLVWRQGSSGSSVLGSAAQPKPARCDTPIPLLQVLFPHRTMMFSMSNRVAEAFLAVERCEKYSQPWKQYSYTDPCPCQQCQVSGGSEPG